MALLLGFFHTVTVVMFHDSDQHPRVLSQMVPRTSLGLAVTKWVQLTDKMGAITLIWRVKCTTVGTQPVLCPNDNKQSILWMEISTREPNFFLCRVSTL